jgi:hypothetical protein
LEAQLTTLQDASVAKGKKIEAAVQSRFRASWTLLDPEVQGKLRLAEQLLQENGGTTAEGTDKVPFIVLATSLAVEIQLKVSVFSREVLRVISEPYRDGLRDFGMLIRRGQTGPPSLQRIKNPSALKDYVALIDFLAVWRNRAVHPSPGRTQADLDRFLSEVHGSKGISGLFETLTDWKQPH